ncbi:MAG: pitrilysin family protein [Bacteroidota bacterium]
MIEFKSFYLDNGLQVIVHEDTNVQTAVINLLYDVGSKDEDSELTGFAHLFEHLMFGGSKHIQNFDEELQRAGGENNAFTSPDITNYYMTLPPQNLETGFWLESDRMLSLSFDPKVLEVQRSVVMEEFKQRYLNQPYGDLWLNLRPLAYKKHPYQWATIGKDISHIEKVTMNDVESFFHKHYAPDNACLVVAGNVTYEEVKRLSEKWFGEIPASKRGRRNLSKEPDQTERRTATLEGKVPQDSFTMAFKTPGKFEPAYYASDLVSDVLGRDKSSRLHTKLVRDEKLFTNINAYITGSNDPGLLVISGKVSQGVDINNAEKGVNEVINSMVSGISEEELHKVKNQAESALIFSDMEVLNRAMRLATASLSGNVNLVNEEAAKINAVSLDDINEQAKAILDINKANVLYYHSEN